MKSMGNHGRKKIDMQHLDTKVPNGFMESDEETISELVVTKSQVDSGLEVLASLGENANYGQQLPRIPVVINGQQIPALIDTGASVDFVRPNVLGEVDLTNSLPPTIIYLGYENRTCQCAHRY
ncbi:hypothetical protein JTB14_028968 [Gonioctena quinquepunctata]|nr:hypothetical protein JTB14_028968 [Gonioctena quinquepunctata]